MPILQRPGWDRPTGGEGNPPSGWRGLLCRLGMHVWDTVYDTGYTAYLRCERCGRRDIAQPNGGHQPVSREWITKGEYPFPNWEDMANKPRATPPPPPPALQSPPPPVRVTYRRTADDLARTFVFDATDPDSIRGFVDGVRAFERFGRNEVNSPAIRNLDYLQEDVREWTRVAFPHSTQVTRARHVLREAAELYAAVRLPEIVGHNDDSEVLWGKLTQEVNKETNATISRIAFYVDAPGNMGEELADILLILCDMAAAVIEGPGTVPWSLFLEARGKLREVKARKYPDSPDSSGVTEHVRDGG